jgi:hypothetical protein
MKSIANAHITTCIAGMWTPRLNTINNRWRNRCDDIRFFWRLFLLRRASMAQLRLHEPRRIPSAWPAAPPIRSSEIMQRSRNARRPPRAALATASQTPDTLSTPMRVTPAAGSGCADRLESGGALRRKSRVQPALPHSAPSARCRSKPSQRGTALRHYVRRKLVAWRLLRE